MYSIIEDSGTQIRAKVGDVLTIDLRDVADDASEVTLDRVLAIGSDDAEARFGTPYVDGASVTARIVEHDVKGEKVHTVKYKRRKGYKRTKNHRQRHMLVEITSING